MENLLKELALLGFVHGSVEYVMDVGQFPAEWESSLAKFIDQYGNLMMQIDGDNSLDACGVGIPYSILAALQMTIDVSGQEIADKIMHNAKFCFDNDKEIVGIAILTSLIFGAFADLYCRTKGGSHA